MYSVIKFYFLINSLIYFSSIDASTLRKLVLDHM